MNKYFKPLDWEINDYVSYINEPTFIDLSPYLNYITEDYHTKDDFVSKADPEGGELEIGVSKRVPIISFLPPKESLPEYKPAVIPKRDTKGESTIVPINKTDFKTRKEFINYFASLYKSEGLNDDLALTLAKQDALESWTKNGLSRLAREGHNYGGIKSFDKNAPSINLGTQEYINGRYVYMDPKKDPESTRFRVFNNALDYVRYKVKWMSTSSKYKGALSGDGDHYLSVITGNNPGGWKYATAPNYKAVIKGIKAKSGGVLIAKNGTPLRNSYNDKDSYDYSGSDYIPADGGHWPSRNPDTGLILKHPDHDTYRKTLKAERELGMRLFKDKFTGREYSFNELDSYTKGMMPGMKEIGYPNDLYSEDIKIYGDRFDLAKKYYSKLRSLGAGDVQAAAMIGVFMQESGLDHDAVSSKGAKGIAQLLGDKYDKYQSWLNKNKKADTAENQIEWIWDYMATAKDDWHDYYLSLYGQSLKDFDDLSGDIKSKAISDWDKMKDSKYAEYNYDAFRDTFYDLGDVKDAVDMFTWTFERPGDMEANMGNRYAYAESLLNYFRYDE